MRFVVARQEYSSDKDSAEAIRVSPRTVKAWKADGAPIDEAVRLMAADGLVMAGKLRRRSLARAMAIKVAGLNSDKEQTRQSVATEIIEWEMGKATQKTEVTLGDSDIDAAIETELAKLAASRKAEALGSTPEPGANGMA